MKVQGENPETCCSCTHAQVYEGEVEPWLMSDYCTDTVPVLLRRATFCLAFAADAKDFRAYNSWVGKTSV